MPTVQPFPFEKLSQYTHESAEVNNQLCQFYPVIKLQKAILSEFIQPLEKTFLSKIKIEIANVSSKPAHDFASDLPQNAICSVLQIQPFATQAYLLFEKSFAQILVSQALSKDKKIDEKKLHALQALPFTSLQEAIVEFFLLELIQSLSDKVLDQNFSLQFSHVTSEKKSYEKHFQNNTSLIHFNMIIQCFDKKFYVSVFLPFMTFQDLPFIQIQQQASFEQDLKSFQNLTTNMTLIAGDVELNMDDINTLEKGDIILFDNTDLSLKNKDLQGKAQVILGDLQENVGFSVNLSSQNSLIKTQIDDEL